MLFLRLHMECRQTTRLGALAEVDASAFAWSPAAMAEASAASKVLSISMNGVTTGDIYVQLDPNIVNSTLGCTLFGGWYKRTYVSEMDKIVVGIALTAYATGREVSISSISCNGPYPNYEIKIYENDGKTLHNTTFTDENGNYVILLSPGKYFVHTEEFGPDFQPEEKINVIDIRDDTEFDILIKSGIR